MRRLLLPILLLLGSLAQAQTLTGVHFVNDNGTMQSNGSPLAMGGSNIVCTFNTGPDDVGCTTQTVTWSSPTNCVSSFTGGTITWNPVCHPNDHTRFPAGAFNVQAVLHVVVGSFSDTAQALVQDSYLVTNCDLSVANVVTVAASPAPGQTFSTGATIAFQGLTTCALLNGQHLVTQTGTNSTQIVVNFTHVAGASLPETTGYVSDIWTQYTTPDFGWFIDQAHGGFYTPSIVPGTTWTMGVGFIGDGFVGNANPFPYCNWTTSNAGVATVARSGIVTGVANGSATITCTTIGQAVIDNTLAPFTGNSATFNVATPTVGSLQTWFVRPDGGTPYVNGTQTPFGQCTGLANAAYPGTTVQRWLPNEALTGVQTIIDTVGHYETSAGSCTTGNSGQPSWSSGTTTDNTCTWTKGATYLVGQACAMGNLRYLWTDEVTPNFAQWMIAPGDTVIVAPVGGNGYYNLGNDWQASGVGGTNGNAPVNCGGSPDCDMPTIPSGTAAHHTKILGSLCQTGCGTTNTFGILANTAGTPVPDRTKLTVIAGTWAQNIPFSLLDSQYVDVAGFRLISPAGCGEVSSFGANQCNEFSSNPNVGNFGKIGIRESAFTSFDTLTDMEITAAGPGIFGASSGSNADGTFNYFWTRVLVQGGGGIDMDDNAHFSDISQAGGLSMSGGGVTFSGCAPGPWPWTLNYPWIGCVDQQLGGTGDGLGTGTTTGFWSFDHTLWLLNEQDGLDLLHSGMQSLSVTNSLAVGNIGNGFKLGNSHTTTFLNNYMQNNCARVLQPYGDQPATLAAGTPDVCRSGEPLAFLMDSYGVYNVNSNSMATYSDQMAEFISSVGYDNFPVANFSFVDNYFIGTQDVGHSSGEPGVNFPGFLNFLAKDYNQYVGVFPCPSLNAHETCNTSYATGAQVVDPPVTVNLGTTEPLYDATNALLNGSGPLAGAGTTYSGQLTQDMNGVANPVTPNIGAFNLAPGVTPPTNLIGIPQMVGITWH